jgi:iron complex transport system ATP-binding protein
MTTQGIAARGVVVRLGGRVILDGVDLEASAGAVTAIVGPNGSGKTTLLRAVAGLLPFAGEVRSGELDLRTLLPAERARRLAYLPQSSALSAMLSVRQVVALGLLATRPGSFFRPRGDDDAIAHALGRVGISALSEQAYPRLSGGQKRLVLLARALVTGASILLLDEPTASLDVKHSLELFQLLASLARDGYTIVVVLHDLDDVQRHASRALLLEAGTVRAFGPASEPAFVQAAEQTYGVALVEQDRLGFRLLPPGAGGGSGG